MPEPDSVSDLLARLRAAVKREFGRTVVWATLESLEDPARPLQLPCPETLTPSAPPSPAEPHPKLNAAERRILRTVAVLDTEDPTAEEIATAAKMKNDPYFRKLLSALRTRGLLGGAKGDVGYPVSPAGLEAIEPETAP